MSAEPLPAFLDVRKAATRNITVKGVVELAGLPRLAQSLVAADGVAEVICSFSRDAENRNIVNLEVTASVMVTCQRCLEPMRLPLQIASRLALVGDIEAAKQLPATLEPWMDAEEQASLWGLVEEELILAVPVVAYHEDTNCNRLLGEYRRPPGVSEERGDNPFKVLEQLKLEHTKEN
ncbi:MAG: YceD family protein [Pseudomonadota bacterium]